MKKQPHTIYWDYRNNVLKVIFNWQKIQINWRERAWIQRGHLKGLAPFKTNHLQGDLFRFGHQGTQKHYSYARGVGGLSRWQQNLAVLITWCWLLVMQNQRLMVSCWLALKFQKASKAKHSSIVQDRVDFPPRSTWKAIDKAVKVKSKVPWRG